MGEQVAPHHLQVPFSTSWAAQSVSVTAAEARLAPALRDKVENLFPIDIMELYYMEKEGTGHGKTNL